MIQIYTYGAEDMRAYLGAIPAKMHQGLARAIAQLGFTLQRQVRQEKLSGQVLQVRTDTLRSSINTVIADRGDEVSAMVGTAVRYGRFHGYGVPHSWLIQARSAKALRFEVGGRVLYRKSVTHPGLPERSFLRSALAEMAPEIAPKLEAAILTALGS